MSLMTYDLASLREPQGEEFLPPPVPSTTGVVWVARAVTFVRIPIAVLGLFALVQGQPAVAVALFTLFAVIDVFDGVAARAAGCDTAARRAGDVFLDRFAIHGAALTACAVYGTGWVVWLCLLSRDVIQLLVSARYTKRTRTVVIGAHWHMAYGLSMLVWGSVFILLGHPPAWATIATAVISVATFGDYAMRCRQLEHSSDAEMTAPRRTVA